MSNIFYKCFRGVVLGLMLLLACGANLVCISFDTDNDEDTPPITVELSLVAPKRSHSLPNKRAQAEVVRQKDLEAASPSLVATVYVDSMPSVNSGSPQEVIPLRR
jgi:hypothetical protein